MKETNEKKKLSLPPWAWCFLAFSSVFLFMLLSYLGTHNESRFFLISDRYTEYPLSLPLGFVGASYALKQACLGVNRERFFIVWLFLKCWHVIIKFIAILLSVTYALEVSILLAE